MSSKIILKKDEYTGVMSFLQSLIHFYFVFGGSLVILAASINVFAQMGMDVSTVLIYALSRIFIVSGIFGLLFIALAVYYVIVSNLIAAGKVKMLHCNRPKRCKNKTRKELVGKQYVMLCCFKFRYAFRLTEK